jgi:hypothetical protein
MGHLFNNSLKDLLRITLVETYKTQMTHDISDQFTWVGH